MRAVEGVLAALALTGLVGVSVPANAVPVESRAESRVAAQSTVTVCDTDTKTWHVAKGGARKVAVTFVARGCVEHTTEADGTVSCSRVTVFEGWRKGSKAKILDNKVVGRGSFTKGSPFTLEWSGCPGFGPHYLQQTQEYGKSYKYPTRCGKLRAFPVVNMQVRGSEGELAQESVVKLFKRGTWKFAQSGTCGPRGGGGGGGGGGGVLTPAPAPPQPGAGG